MRPPTLEMLEHLKRLRDSFGDLIGAKVVDVIVEPDPEYGVMRPRLGLVLVLSGCTSRFEKHIVWASQDAEGNGPGWLEVEVKRS